MVLHLFLCVCIHTYIHAYNAPCYLNESMCRKEYGRPLTVQNLHRRSCWGLIPWTFVSLIAVTFKLLTFAMSGLAPCRISNVLHFSASACCLNNIHAVLWEWHANCDPVWTLGRWRIPRGILLYRPRNFSSYISAGNSQAGSNSPLWDWRVFTAG